MRCRAVLLAAALLGAGAAEAKTNMPALPPYAGAYQPQGVDERGVWMEADQDERVLRDSKLVIHDAALEAYVRKVLCDTVGADRCGTARIYIVRVPEFNANMAPNGRMAVYSGLLLRARSEAELAGVLGHEFAHFEQRHTLKGYRQRRTATDIMMWAGFLGGNAMAIQAAAAGSIFSFNREEEKEADLKSFAYLAASRYRPEAEAEIWDREMDEVDASALGRKQRSQRYDRVGFFASHPTSLDRSRYLHAEAVKLGKDGDDGVEPYQAAIAKWRGMFLADQLKLNDFEGTEYLLGQLAREGWSADLLVARGDLYRMRGHPRDLVSAADFYRQAIAKGAEDPVVHRNLGLALLRGGAPAAEGASELRHYVAARPQADDVAMITMLIDQSSAP